MKRSAFKQRKTAPRSSRISQVSMHTSTRRASTAVGPTSSTAYGVTRYSRETTDERIVYAISIKLETPLLDFGDLTGTGKPGRKLRAKKPKTQAPPPRNSADLGERRPPFVTRSCHE